jgi:hypothetical protein
MELAQELTKTPWQAMGVAAAPMKIQTVEMVTMRYIIKEADYGITIKR